MSPLYIHRIETVVSLQQLAADAEACTPPGAAAREASELAPDAPVSGIACSRLPKYTFASDAAPAKVARVNSANDFARVPDVDDGDGSSCSSIQLRAIAASAGVLPKAEHAQAGLLPLGGGGGGGGGDDDASSSCEGSVVDAGCVPVKSLLDSVLLAMWEECAEQGLFRYDVTTCPTKVVPGMYGFVAQLNEGRYSKKRPTEFRIDQVVQAFDPAKFNFTKAFRREVLFAFEPGSPGCAPVFEESGRAGRCPSVVLINVSPIDYGHVLLCPRVLDCLPQNLTPGTARLALHFALELANPYVRVGFNSLGAFATINHLHFQAYYLAAPLPCERAPTRPLRLGPRAGGGGGDGHAKRGAPGAGAPTGHVPAAVSVSLLSDYPVRGWVVEGPSLAAMAQVVGEASLAMQVANVPHNVLIADCGARVFIWPQAFAERQARGQVPAHLLDIGVNPAVWEISGHMVLKRAQDYEAFTEAAAWELLAAVSLSEADMASLSDAVFGAGAAVVGSGATTLEEARAAVQAQQHAAAAALVPAGEPRAQGGLLGADAALAVAACGS